MAIQKMSDKEIKEYQDILKRRIESVEDGNWEHCPEALSAIALAIMALEDIE